jgi:hypothetical protein
MVAKNILMRVLLVSAGCALLGSAASAAPFFLRGEFNDWGNDGDIAMTEISPAVWSATVTGQTSNGMYHYKVAEEDWSASWPGSNGRVQFDNTGSATFYFYDQGNHGDGWQPDGFARVGYDDTGHGWDIMGSFNGWAAPVVVLTNMGGGFFEGQAIVENPGNYEFKFRKEGDWEISIGNDFGNAAGDIQYSTTTSNETVIFRLDLPNGRWQVIPEPASLGLVGLMGLGLLRRRR